MDQFRRLMWVALSSGAIAGFVLFVVQHLTVRPLIQQAEIYEHAASEARPNETHEDEGWQPSEGFERTTLTALATTLTGVGFSAILFGTASLLGTSLNLRRGALWGLAGFACFTLAPAFGMLPLPPGTGVADVTARQIWWAGTAVATALGIWAVVHHDSWGVRGLGVITLLLPHIVGAPVATGPDVVPIELVHRFAFTSVVTTGIFWLLLGGLGGWLYGRSDAGLQKLVSIFPHIETPIVSHSICVLASHSKPMALVALIGNPV